MAASAFSTFKNAKLALGDKNIDLGAGVYRLVLVKSGATLLSTGTSATTWASLKTDGVTEVTEAGGYSSSGESLVSPTWALSGLNGKFDATDWSLSVTADLSLVKACLIRASASDRIIFYSSLSTSGFDVSSGNKLTITFNSAGIVTLS